MIRFAKKISQKNVGKDTPVATMLMVAAVLLFVTSPFSVANAEVGGIGSSIQTEDEANDMADGTPVVDKSSNVSPEDELKRAVDAENAAASKDAVMIIRFNQKNVYFQSALKKVVYKVAASKPDARYELISTVPAKKKSLTDADDYAEHLQSVINVLGRFGVSSDKISSNTVTSDFVQNQEISIFIH
jgi:hypothetical protein